MADGARMQQGLDMVLEDSRTTVESLELELCRLPEVSSARAVADEHGAPAEIHVLAKPGKTAKQIARDVVSVAHASFGFELDRRIVSVVQLDDERLAAAPGADIAGLGDLRPRIASVSTESSGMRAVVRVTLEQKGTETVGFAEGSVARATRPRLVALAALDALHQIEPSAEALDVETAQVVRVGSCDVAVVAVVFVDPPNEQIVSGSAVVRDAEAEDAIARAVLDATNRRLLHTR